MGRAAAWFDRRLNREKRSERNRIIRGALVVFILVGFSFALGVFVLNKAGTAPFGRYIEILLLAVFIPARQVFDEARLLGAALKGERFDPSRVPFLVEGDFDSAKMDSYALARLAVERLAERFGKDAMAPVFWFVLLGLPGVFLSRAARVLALRLGGMGAAHQAFGFAPRQFDAVLGFLPARLSGLVPVVAALFAPTASPARALYLFFAGGVFTFGFVAVLAYHA